MKDRIREMSRSAYAGVALAAVVVSIWVAPAMGQTASIATQPIRAVVLIDESGSLSAESVKDEANATSLLAFAELSNQSSFLVAGFASSNGKGQSAFVQYCPFIKLADQAARERVAACAGHAHRRTAREGDDTDHAAALDFAVSQLANTPKGTAPVVFLLTDGNLNVSSSPQYGRTPKARNREAQRQLTQRILPAARRAGIAIWPLGFGADARRQGLESFASGGAAGNNQCKAAEGARPKAVMVGSSATILSDLLELLARSRCAHAEPPVSGDLQPGKTVTLKVKLPSIATDGTISVTKLDPYFRVEYYDPDGEAALDRGEREGQTFSRSGQNGQVEALRIENPKPGTWTVKVTAPKNRPARRVLARAVWSGVLQASIRISPALPKPGQRVIVELHLVTRYGVIRDPADLTGLVATAQVSGDFGTPTIPLNDAGRDGDAVAKDGTFSGPFTMPSGKVSCLQITGQIAKPGIAADERTYSVCTSPGEFAAVFNLPVPDNVHPGDVISGAISFTNQLGPRQVRLIIAEHSDAAQISVAPAAFSVPQGTSKHRFQLRFAEGSQLGDVSARLQLVDPDGKDVGDAYVSATAVAVPSWLSRYWWLIALCALAVVGMIAAVMAVVRRRQRAALVDGLVAVLSIAADEQRGSGGSVELAAPEREKEFRIGFVSDDQGPRLLRAGSEAEAAFIVRRAGAQLAIQGRGMSGAPLAAGTAISIEDGVTLTITDLRRARSRPSRTRRRGGPPAGGAAQGPPSFESPYDPLA